MSTPSACTTMEFPAMTAFENAVGIISLPLPFRTTGAVCTMAFLGVELPYWNGGSGIWWMTWITPCRSMVFSRNNR